MDQASMIRPLTFAEETTYDQPLLLSYARNTTENINTYNMVAQPNAGQRFHTFMPSTSSVAKSTQFGTQSAPAPIIPVQNFRIPINANSVLPTSNMEISMQCDVSLTNTVGNEMNPATAIFGTIYSMKNGCWVAEKQRTPYIDTHFQVKNVATVLNGGVASAIQFISPNANTYSLNGTLTTIAAGTAFPTYTGSIVQTMDVNIGGVHFNWTTTSNGTTISGYSSFKVNGIELVGQTADIYINGNTYSLAANASGPKINLVDTAVNGIKTFGNPRKVADLATAVYQIDPFYKAGNRTETCDEIAIAPSPLNSTGFINMATLNMGSATETVDRVFRRGVFNQINIPQAVQKSSYEYTLWDFVGACQIDTRYKNFNMNTNDTIDNTVSAGNAHRNEYYVPTNEAGQVDAANATTGVLNTGKVSRNCISWDLLVYPQNTGSLPNNYQQYVNSGWYYTQANTGAYSVNDKITFKTQMNIVIPLNMIFNSLRNKELLTPALRTSTSEINITINFQQNYFAQLFGGLTRQGEASGCRTNQTTGAVVYGIFPTAGSNGVNQYPGIPFLDQDASGLTRITLNYKQVNSQQFAEEIMMRGVIQQCFQKEDYQQWTQNNIMSFAQNIEIQSAHKSVNKIRFGPLYFDDFSNSGCSVYWMGRSGIWNGTQLVNLWNSGYSATDQIVGLSKLKFSYGNIDQQQQEVMSLAFMRQITRQAFNISSQYRFDNAMSGLIETLVKYPHVYTDWQKHSLLNDFDVVLDGCDTYRQRTRFSSQLFLYNSPGSMDTLDSTLLVQLQQGCVNQNYPNMLNQSQIQLEWQTQYDQFMILFPRDKGCEISEAPIEYDQ